MEVKTLHKIDGDPEATDLQDCQNNNDTWR